MTDRLITIGASHDCKKARWALQRAGAPFQRSPIRLYAEEGHSSPGVRDRLPQGQQLTSDGPGGGHSREEASEHAS